RECAECRGRAGELRELGAALGRLPAPLPARDLWPGIAATLGADAGHPFADEELSAWLDGELTPSRAARLEAHLAACPPCAARAEDLRAIVSELARLEAPQATPLLWSRVSARTAPRRAPARIAALRRAWLPAGVGIAAALAG